ncbi:hypothetical protein JQK19_03710 [Chromobacterium violaceum]|uniref:hypothetical protein n=1 Tax=Chromobacterium violaceum TaxID=536 RepID=UPI001BEB723E|nr:hypothetical protein [Chromobacterium violaceum]MBT2866338.1 hypothetical protein [Chromobacterium violaceum]
MIVVLSGEGPSDLGMCNNAQGICRKPHFIHGPMTVIVDKEIEVQLSYSILETTPDRYIYVSEERLQELEVLRKRDRRRISLVGKKQDQETGYFYINSWMLGLEALSLEKQEEDSAIAVLFRDCDGTRDNNRGLWDAKYNSMVNGFNRSELCERGVPMIPKPKSESWLLCAVVNNYQHCAVLEELPGNDNSPRSAKKQLHKALKQASTSQDQVNWLNLNGFDHVEVAKYMPSYRAFKAKIAAALTEVR